MEAVAKKKRKTSFGKRLRQLREESGLTQSEVAERVGLIYQTVAKYERGEMEPTWAVVLAFADVFAVTPDAFLDPPPES